MENSEEIVNVNTIDRASPHGRDPYCLTIRGIQWTKAKVRVYSDFVRCLEKMSDSKDAITRWEGQVEELKNVPFLQRVAGNRWRTN